MENLQAYFLNFPQFAITWGIFFGAGLLSFFFLLRRDRSDFSFREMFEHCVPFNVLTSKSFHMDVIIYVWRKLTDLVFVAPGLAATALVSGATDIGLRSVFADFSPLGINYVVTFSCTIVMLIAAEFADYLVHYLEHKVPALWELHKVHHSADFLNPLTSKRGHSFPLVYGGIVAGVITGMFAGLFMFLFGISLVEAVALRAVASKIFTIWTLDPLKHSHIPVSLGWFDRFLISPHMHQIHHSKVERHWDKNFGTNLSIFDWMFGTGYRPEKGEKAVFGISGYSDASLQKFNTFKGAYFDPVLRSWKAIVAQVRPDTGAKPGAKRDPPTFIIETQKRTEQGAETSGSAPAAMAPRSPSPASNTGPIG
ncbi:sterol desaturase family protein [Neorhizobium galegae]|uniref:sterol desaturase family protein n=1 Tax=Neorhizobium galegae TaxID=399 RepID=UPI000622904C|nr:sterol desaturase family protein [Neorhizobium galegae]KAB1120083.1 sterol desaturase family protein [Neorhizobium galegae]MCQ1809003.1 sterol desaturase family protein [Neorhizobium galegae]CDZ64464.1 Fatty acid hydroxylase [Neorhizobium galegae bv. orientalis]